MPIRKKSMRVNADFAKNIVGNQYMVDNYIAGVQFEENPNPIGLLITYYKNRVGFSVKYGTYTLDGEPVGLKDIYKYVNNYRKEKEITPLNVPYFFVH